MEHYTALPPGHEGEGEVSRGGDGGPPQRGHQGHQQLPRAPQGQHLNTSIYNLFSICNIQVSIDNWVFKLYYKFTTTLLVLSSVLASAK